MSVSLNNETDDLMTRFLLGELSEEERTKVEQQFLADNQFFDHLLAVEDSLVDEYLLGQLSDDQRRRAKILLQSSSAQKRDVEFTRELIALIHETNPAKNLTTSAVGQRVFIEPMHKADLGKENIFARPAAETSASAFSLIAAGLRNLRPRFTAITGLITLLVCFSLVYWIFHLYSQKRGWEAQRAAMERSNQEARERLREEAQGRTELNKQLGIERERRAKAEELAAQLQSRGPGEVTSIVLYPTMFERGANSKTVTLKPKTGRIQIQLELDSSQHYDQYSVMLTTFDGRKFWSKDSIRPAQSQQGRLTLVLPPSLLKYEDYRIELRGLSANGNFVHVADYTFKVRR